MGRLSTARRRTGGVLFRVEYGGITQALADNQSESLDGQRSLFDIKVFPEPDEIWISSIMTYWWESTRDVIQVCKEVFPKALIRVGGIYPTLAPEHAMANLGLRDPLHIQGRELNLGDADSVGTIWWYRPQYPKQTIWNSTSTSM